MKVVAFLAGLLMRSITLIAFCLCLCGGAFSLRFLVLAHVGGALFIVLCCITLVFEVAQVSLGHMLAGMELLIVNYVALFYVLLIYTSWKRWYYSLCTGGGRRSLKRLKRCAPQVLVRVARQQQQCELLLQSCVERQHWLHYCFCYYYGGHAKYALSWVMAAGSLYCLWNDVLGGV